MAQKSAQSEVVLNVEEALDIVDKTMERVKSLYEQYFLGIQKQPPTFIHNDLERKLRDLQQVQIRNTALRYRYATLQQKFGSYNSYWRRTLRQIENGTYVRQLAKIGRKAIESGDDIPEEILAKMPKRMREQVRRDREAALALAQRRNQVAGEGDFYDDFDASSAPAAPVARKDARGAHLLSEDDDLDLDAYFKQVEAEEEAEHTVSGPPPRPEFEDVATPAIAAAPPSGPANLRAAALGGLPRAQSPAVRPSSPAIPATPTPRASVPMPNRPRADTEPGEPPMSEPGRPSSPPGAYSRGQAPGQSGAFPRAATPIPAIPPNPSQSGAFPRATTPDPGQSGAARPSVPMPATGAIPTIPKPGQPGQSGAMRAQPADPANRSFAPSQVARPNPIAPGSSAQKQVDVETMQGPFAREPSVAVPPRRTKRDTDLDMAGDPPTTPATPTPAMAKTPTPQPMRPSQPPARPTPQAPTQPLPRAATPQAPTQPLPRAPTPPARPSQPMPRQPTPPPAARPAMRPPPGMTDDDVNALYTKYVKAKEMVGETTNAQTYGKLLNTINAQAPKIMEQYKAKGVDFSVVVKDNQVIIKAKPKP